jgi:hypothetical protein
MKQLAKRSASSPRSSSPGSMSRENHRLYFGLSSEPKAYRSNVAYFKAILIPILGIKIPDNGYAPKNIPKYF